MIQEVAEGREGCPFDTERHPPRPWVGGADDHTRTPCFPTEKVGDQAQAGSEGLARGLAQVSNRRVFRQLPNLCLASRDLAMSRDVSRSLVQTEDLRSSVVALDGSDGRTQQLETPEVGRAGGAVSSEMSFFVG